MGKNNGHPTDGKKYRTTIVIETDYYPEELAEGYAAFFINLPTNNQARVLTKEIKEHGDINEQQDT
jgi:hypothetical protein